MRNNRNSTDPQSWAYWSNIHRQNCPHRVSYFFAWHRGYLIELQKQLRIASGDPDLVLPYWDFYANPTLPAEFTDPMSPLYVPNRANTNVAAGLSLEPFTNDHVTFPRTAWNDPHSFEGNFEITPHNAVHNILGGVMADLDSPMDPIFWIYHANVDRLWVGWVNAGNGRSMPARTSTYWNGTHTYSSTITMPRIQTYDTTGLSYTYDNVALPSSLPPTAMYSMRSNGIVKVQFGNSMNDRTLRRPADDSFTPIGPRQLNASKRALGGAKNLQFNDTSSNLRIPIQVQDRSTLQSILAGASNSPFTKSGTAASYNSVQLVLDNMDITASGKYGGYFYEVYLNLPSSLDKSIARKKHFVGSFGAFKMATLKHHGGAQQMTFPVTHLLKAVPPQSLDNLSVSVIRVNGKNAPRGTAITVGEVRIEIANGNGNGHAH
jgi:tyrosinase